MHTRGLLYPSSTLFAAKDNRTRLCWLQLAFDYLRFDDIVNTVEEGVMLVLFTTLEQMIKKFCIDNELGQASYLWKRCNHLKENIECSN
jgi:hypothetical protein